MNNKRDDYFATYHPFINFIYFVFVIGTSMFVMHPVFLCISLIGAISYNILLCGYKKALKECICLVLPIVIIATIVNSLFSHYGVTILFYFYNGNPITLESIVYGIVMAVMLCEVILWFKCYNIVMTSDKFIYLFGGVIPAMSLILSMCFRFVPRFRSRMKMISNGQKCIGRDVSNGKPMQKIRNGIRILSILITWSLEKAIDTADSMKSRGYGLPGRTAFSIYFFGGRDRIIMCVMSFLTLTFITGCIKGYTAVQYNPWIEINNIPPSFAIMIVYIAYGIFCMIPIILNLADNIRWSRRQKKIKAVKQKGYRLWT